MRKIILQCGLSPGDIVMLTAAVRDLHRYYPGEFLTDVRTTCEELWENNPHLTPLSEADSSVEIIACECPLINESNRAPYHYLHAFIEFLNERLGLRIRPTEFKGDIHLSEQEKAWHSQVHELTGEETPFWIVAGGGKYDVTIKWWSHERYQEVVDHFRNELIFVQVGAAGHFHPKLKGTIDLRGRTGLRELARLVYHSSGVVCGVTALMHLAAAIELKPGQAARPCVVVAGGREPAHWEEYPNHQFISTNGALPCCAEGGCWRARTTPLGDGDDNDKPEHLCVDVVGELPRCMEMISAAEVCRRIELYLEGGTARRATEGELAAGRVGIEASEKNPYDERTLTFHNARIECERFIRAMPAADETYSGRGIVICGGGVRYFTSAWVCINMLRRLGCGLPIQLWHLGPGEVDGMMADLVRGFGVECVDAREVEKKHPARRLAGWELKAYALLHSPFQEVMLLDADNLPIRNPEYLFDAEQYRETGAIFWPDVCEYTEEAKIWESLGMTTPRMAEFESGQIVIDKRRCWKPLRLALWFNEHSDFFYEHVHGDKQTFHLAWHKMRKSYGFVPTPVERLYATMCQHDFDGERIFQHRNLDKWNLFLRNERIEGFLFEEECRGFVETLRERWDGGAEKYVTKMPRFERRAASPSIKLCMISCEARAEMRAKTIANLAATDWSEEPAVLEIDASGAATPQVRQTQTAFLALQRSLSIGAEFIVFVEDDVEFNRHLRHNLERWKPLAEGRVSVGGLYNPGLRPLACHGRENFSLVSAFTVYGSQGFVISEHALKFIIQNWETAEGMHDLRISRLAARLQEPLFYHTPSLVQHVGTTSVWGGHFHSARDFDPDFKA